MPFESILGSEKTGSKDGASSVKGEYSTHNLQFMCKDTENTNLASLSTTSTFESKAVKSIIKKFMIWNLNLIHHFLS